MNIVLRSLLLLFASLAGLPAYGAACQAPGPGQPIRPDGCMAEDRRVLLGSRVAQPSPPPEPKTVHITTFSAQPAKLQVPVGTSVTWKNYDEITHSIVLPQTRSDRLWAKGFGGKTFSYTFDEPGEYAFQCGVHNDVHGRITVSPAAAAAADEPAPAYPGHTLSGLPSHVTQQAPVSQPSPMVRPHAMPVQPAPAPQAQAAGPAGQNAVVIRQHAFHPPELLVTPGTRVTWRNQDGSRHSLVFDDMTSEVMANGQALSRVFDSPGEYPYQCGIHGYMKGTVRVQG